MAGFGDLINKAIVEQGAQNDPAARSRIYESSRAALKRMLAANGDVTSEAAKMQWTKLDEAIDALETRFSATSPPAPPTAPAPSTPTPPAPPPVPRTNPTPASAAPQSSPPPAPAVEPRVTPPPPMPPSVSAPQRLEPAFDTPTPAPSPEPQVSVALHASPAQQDDAVAPTVAPAEPPPSYRGNALKTRRPYARWLAWIIILTGLGVAAWWAWTFGPQLLRDTVEQQIANPQSTITRGPFDPDEGWISVFDPASDPTAIVTENRGTAELITQADGTVARLRSSNPDTSGNLLIRVPPGIVEQMRGKATTFEIVMAAPADGDQEVALYCRFDALGSCGRKRFAVGQDVQAQIFDVLTENVDLPAGRDAYLAINTDLGGQNRSIDIAAIRMRTGD